MTIKSHPEEGGLLLLLSYILAICNIMVAIRCSSRNPHRIIVTFTQIVIVLQWLKI